MLTKEQAQEVRDVLLLEMRKVLKKYGYRGDLGRFTYDPMQGNFKVRLVGERQTDKSATVAPIPNERAAIGRKFRIRTRCFEVTKELGHGRKYTLMAKRLPDGKLFKVSLKTVQDGAY